MYTNILVAVDLGEYTNELVEKAFLIVKENNAKMKLLHSVEHMPVYAYGYVATEQIEQEMTQEAKNQFEKLAGRLGLQKEDCFLERKSAKAAILDVSASVGADLVIIGSHGSHGLLYTLGSTASAVVNNAPCDVLVLRQQEQKNT